MGPLKGDKVLLGGPGYGFRKILVQIKLDETAQLLNKPYVNDVYLIETNLT